MGDPEGAAKMSSQTAFSVSRLPGRIYPYYLLAKLYSEPNYRDKDKFEDMKWNVLNRIQTLKRFVITTGFVQAMSIFKQECAFIPQRRIKLFIFFLSAASSGFHCRWYMFASCLWDR